MALVGGRFKARGGSEARSTTGEQRRIWKKDPRPGNTLPRSGTNILPMPLSIR